MVACVVLLEVSQFVFGTDGISTYGIFLLLYRLLSKHALEVAFIFAQLLVLVFSSWGCGLGQRSLSRLSLLLLFLGLLWLWLSRSLLLGFGG